MSAYVRHVHRAVSWKTRAFAGPVRTPEKREAHGGYCEVAACRCGAERRTNFNGLHAERGPWIEAKS